MASPERLPTPEKENKLDRKERGGEVRRFRILSGGKDGSRPDIIEVPLNKPGVRMPYTEKRKLRTPRKASGEAMHPDRVDDTPTRVFDLNEIKRKMEENEKAG